MYVCHCKAVTDRDIRSAILAGARDVDQVEAATGAMSTCGSCEATVCALLAAAGCPAHALQNGQRVAV